jgi:tripartite motif-containing protein 71
MAGSRKAALMGLMVMVVLVAALVGCGKGGGGAAPKYVAQFNGSGDSNGPLNCPEGLGIDEQGKLLVVDTWNDRILRCDADGKSLSVFGKHGVKKGELETPRSACTDAQGNVYVADAWNQRIQKFSRDGNLLLVVGAKGAPFGNDEAKGKFVFPYGVAVDSKGNIYVSVYNNNRLHKFDAKGKFVLMWGVEGRQDGQFSKPGALAMDKQDRLYVADVGNNRVQRFTFDSDGKPSFDGQWGKDGKEPGEFDRPYGLCVDKDGSFFVADYGNHRVQKFDASGRVQFIYDKYGSEEGALDQPVAVAVDGSGSIFVSDLGNKRIVKLTPAA